MTTIQEYDYLQAELSTLNKMLIKLPESSLIERMSLESRREIVEKALALLEGPLRQPARFSLTFRGAPIFGSHGVQADFGGFAIKKFADAVRAIGTSQTETLGSHGALPNREEYKLLITGVARGSFGFVIEEPSENYKLTKEFSPLESAIHTTMSILKASIETDEELNEALSESDPRAIKELHDFVKYLADNEAVCTLQSGRDSFSFSDVGQIRQSEKRLSEDNICEEHVTFTGAFHGYLPNKRMFEFSKDDSGEVISGRVDSSIEDAGEINRHLDQPAVIHLLERSVGVSKHHTYTLTGFEFMGGVDV